MDYEHMEIMTETTFERVEYISFANVIASLAVVFLHVNRCFWDFSATESYWFSANIIECIFYFAVPVFFMITGSTLMDFYERYSLKNFISKRFRKTIIPYIVWSFIGLFAQVFFHIIPVEDINYIFVINGILNGTLVKEYWFFPALFSCYLSIPLFAAVKKEKKISVYFYIVIVAFLLNKLPMFLNDVLGLGISFSITFVIGSGYLIFLCIGYIITHANFSIKTRTIIYLLSIAGLLMHIIGTRVLSVKAGEIVSLYKGYYNVPSIIYASGIFVLLRYGGEKAMRNILICRLINTLDTYTLGVYLIHILFIFGVSIIFPSKIELSLLWRLTAPALIFALSVFVIWCFRKIPLLRKIVP